MNNTDVPCMFPFKHLNETFNSCYEKETDDGPKHWCKTGTGDVDWGVCEDMNKPKCKGGM